MPGITPAAVSILAVHIHARASRVEQSFKNEE